VENRGFWALEAPPKREKQMNTRGPIYRLAGHWSAFERTTYVRTHQLFVVERRVHVRPQITAVAARADWACVRPQTLGSNAELVHAFDPAALWVLRATVVAARPWVHL
jgi:hypothetical protein